MTSRISRRTFPFVFAIVWLAGASSAAAADPIIKVAFWNMRAGHGIAALPGHAATFVDTPNCTDTSQPLNAWGVGAPQAELARVASDPSVVAVGVVESWGTVCASPNRIRAALGWQAASTERNGIALVARFGFAGAEQWQQLDTSLNPNPADTMWVLRVPVCLNAACSNSMPVYVAHWYAMGTSPDTIYSRQAQQTAAFLTATSGGQPHVLVGDLNVWEGSTIVCSETPTNTALPYLRGAGYMDAWLTVHGAAEGYTGMANRAGCGYPVGYAFKRIDYAWTPVIYPPIDVQRFGMVTPGDAAPSDHYGVVVTLPYPGAPAPAPAPTPTAGGNIVLYAKNAPTVAGAWTVVADATAAGGARMSNPDAGAAKLASAYAAPASYFELPFTAETGRAYRLWIRGRAQNDSWQNDSTFVQFSGSTDGSGVPAFRIGTSSATVVSIEEASGAGLSAWGWQDNGYGYGVFGPLIYFDTASQRLRVQVREDGMSIDQIVLSPVQYASTAPGAAKNDATILAESSTTTTPTPTPVPASGAVAWTNVINGATNGAELWKTSGCGQCSDAGAVSQQTITDGTLTFTVTGGRRLTVGLGRDTSANTGYAIDYAFAFCDTGAFEIREAGIYRAEGRFSASDVFKVTVASGVVRYYRNDALVYTSRVLSTVPLVVDASLESIGAGVTSATIAK